MSGGGYGETETKKADIVNKADIPPEATLAQLMKRDLGITVNPQALRIWIRWRWERIDKLSHEIHNA